MKKSLLKFLLRFSGFWNKFEVNTAQVEAILEVKLKMDSRRESSFNYKKSGKETNYTDAILAFFYFLFGLFGFSIFLMFDHLPSAMSIYFTFWIILLLVTLITDFTEVLIDIRDNYIILPTPINNNTLTVSRILHLVIYLAGLIIPFSISAIIYLAIKVGFLTSIVLLFQLLLSLFVAILAVNIIYMLLLNFTSAQKFKEIINYFQIAFSIIIFSSYYVLPKFITPEFGEAFNINDHWWQWLLPGYYLAGFNELMSGNINSIVIIKSLIGISLPLICLYLIVFKFGQNFSQKLLSLTGSGTSEKKPIKNSEHSKSESLMLFWTDNFIKNAVEKTYFKFTWRLTSRSRLYKLRTYPLFGFLPAFFIYTAFVDNIEVSRMEDLRNSNNDIFLIYLVIFGILTPLLNSKFSENFKARSIIKSLPIDSPGYIIRGNLKALFFKYGIPLYVISLVTILGLWGLEKWMTPVVGLINIVFCMVTYTFIFQKNIPFSEPWENQSKGSNTTKTFVLMFIISIMGFGHYMLKDNLPLLFTYAIIMFVASIMIYRQFPNIKWRDIA